MPKFAVRRLFLSICAGALGAMGPRSGLAESLPSPTLPQLLAADVIAVGHFELVQGKIQFLPRRMLKGDAAAGAALVAQFFVRATPEGKLIARSRDESPMKEGYSEHDATLDAIWFLGPNDRQPLELADGFAALLAGKKPELLFSLLQRFDFDQRQDAMEELFAQPDAVVVARLHTLALGDDVYLAADAAAILTRTKLFDPRQMWGKWLRAPATNFLIDALAQRDPVRTTQELAAAIGVEQDPQRLENMLYQISRAAPNRLELVLPYIDHPSANVRARILVSIWDTLWELEAANTPESIRRFTELAPRILPLLQQRAAVETDPLTQRRLIEMLTPVNGVPWILAIPQGTLHGPIDSYTEDAELDFLVRCLTSRNQGGFISETAGREIAQHFFDEGFLRLRNDVRSSNFNRETVYEGMTYVADPRVLEYFKQNADPLGLMVIPRQNQPDSLAIVKNFLAQHGKPGDFENVGTGVLAALADISDPEALDLLKSLKPQVTKSQKMSYLRALAMHGDAWAQGELLAAFQQPPAAQFLDADYWSRQGIAQILCMIDTPAATAALRQYVEEQWPKSSGAEGYPPGVDMENYAGPSRRSAPLGEVARRDPQWLAGLALEKMASPIFAARSYGSQIFQQLTGQLGGYRADAFASEREAPLKTLQNWWQSHTTESRETWLINYFHAKGFSLDHLDKTALPALSDALESDYFTHCMAVEQISAICQKYFCDFTYQPSYLASERTTARVRGWLRARGLLAP